MQNKCEKMRKNMQKFVRYSDGAKMYSMGLTKFQELAKDAKACYKVGQLVLVNTEILDEYLETFRIVEDEFYK
ncbi:MAG: transcriptional regulator [Lachnospiraceae bacterium]|nr:transcriptional regulator [Lachnospiraceae bacterium]